MKSSFVAAESAGDVRYDVHVGTPTLTALRMSLSLAARHGGNPRPRSVALYDIVAAFVHATIDVVVARRVLLHYEGTREASKRWQQHDTRVFKRFGWRGGRQR